MKAFKKREISFLIQLVVFTTLLFGTQSYLVNYFAGNKDFVLPLWQIYSFHFAVTLVFFTIINYSVASGKKNIIVLFMGMTFTKMVLAILFLLPLLMSDYKEKQPDLLNFFIPYFLYLFFEVFSISKFLQKH